LGTELRKLNSELLCPTSNELDITNPESINNYFSSNTFEVVIHAAAYTDVTKTEKDFENALDINIAGTYNLLKSCISRNIKLIYISTDYVFDGEEGDYKPSDPLNPLTKYAKSKAAAELMVRMYDNSLCIRTSFFGSSFPYDKALEDQWTTKDYIDVMAPKILKECLSGKTGISHCYSKKRTVYNLAKIRNKNISKIKRKDLDFVIPRDTSLC